MSRLNEMGIERWRARGDLPGARAESHTHVCLFSDSSGPRLLVSHSNLSRLFNNFCRAVAVTYRFEMASVSIQQIKSLQDVPSLTLGETEPKAQWWDSLLQHMML